MGKVWVNEFLLGCSQSYSRRTTIVGIQSNLGTAAGERIDTQIYYIWINIISNIRLYAYDCVIYSKITDNSAILKLWTSVHNVHRFQEWALENKTKKNPSKSKTVSFTKGRLKEKIRHYFGDQLIPEASRFKYCRIVIRNDLN